MLIQSSVPKLWPLTENIERTIESAVPTAGNSRSSALAGLAEKAATDSGVALPSASWYTRLSFLSLVVNCSTKLVAAGIEHSPTTATPVLTATSIDPLCDIVGYGSKATIAVACVNCRERETTGGCQISRNLKI
jgi:hypothetical protein